MSHISNFVRFCNFKINDKKSHKKIIRKTTDRPSNKFGCIKKFTSNILCYGSNLYDYKHQF